MDAKIAGLKWELKRSALFGELEQDVVEALLARGKAALYRARDQIFAQGAPGDCLFVILSGRVKISAVTPSGKEVVLSFLAPGEVLGEIALFDGGARTAAAYALEDTRVLRLMRADVIAFLTAQPETAIRIIAALCARLRKTNLALEDVAALPAAPRLARALLRLADDHGKALEHGAVRIDMKLSQSAVGAHAGLMRENVNRQMRMWEEAGLVRTEGGVITLIDPPALEALQEM